MTPTEITQFNPIQAELETLKAQNASLVFLYNTPAGNKNARSHVFKLRQRKADVERAKKTAKADVLDYGRRVDAIAARLTYEFDEMIIVHQKPLDELDRIEAEAKAERERKEREAIALAERIVREKQEADLAEARAEAAKVQAEMVEMRRKEYEARIAREAEARATAESAMRERAAVEAKHRAEQAKLDAERQAIEAEKRAIQEARNAEARAEQEKIESERRAVEAAERAKVEQETAVKRERRQEEEARKAAEEEMRKNTAVREGVVQEIAAAIDTFLMTHKEDFRLLAEAMLDGAIPHVTVDLTANTISE